MNSPDTSGDTAAPPSARRRGLIALALACLLCGGAWAVWWFGYGRWELNTDNAYVGGNLVPVTAEVAGPVREIRVRETDSVASGQTLLEVDPADARLALDAAVAELGSTVRQVRTMYVQVERLRAQVAAREVELGRAREDLERRIPVGDDGAIAAE